LTTTICQRRCGHNECYCVPPPLNDAAACPPPAPSVSLISTTPLNPVFSSQTFYLPLPGARGRPRLRRAAARTLRVRARPRTGSAARELGLDRPLSRPASTFCRAGVPPQGRRRRWRLQLCPRPVCGACDGAPHVDPRGAVCERGPVHRLPGGAAVKEAAADREAPARPFRGSTDVRVVG
jgi:hypothetical protein